MLLLIGLLPFWDRIRTIHWAQAGLTGANAAVVGLLLAAFIDPVWSNGIRSFLDLGLGLVAFTLLYKFNAPAWATVLGCGLAGHLFLS
jgi:chromate transporter